MTPDDKENALHAYKLTLKGIVVTFIICNILIVAAMAAGFFYTISIINQTNKNLNDKIEKSYAAWAEFGNKQAKKIDDMTDEIKMTNKLFFETLGVTIEDFKSGRKEVYEKLKESGKDALLKYLKKKTSSSSETAPEKIEEQKPK